MDRDNGNSAQDQEKTPNETKGSQPTGRTSGATSPRKIRYAVVGLGYIAQAAVLPAFAHAEENSELAALVSGDPGKLKAVAKRYKVKKTYSYEQYAECLASGIDAVYIALPNSMHREYSEAALRAGVHVLCEKPMATTEEDCRAMIDAAAKTNVKLMIAYRLHFERGNLSAIEAIREGKIGEPRIFHSVFAQQVEPGNTRLRSDLGGGPLFDMGIYCINAARYLFGEEPYEVFSFAAKGTDERFAEVEEMNAAILRFPNDRLASFTCSFGAADRSEYEVVGTKGSLRMDPGYEMVGDLKSELMVGGKKHKTTFKKRDQFGPELTYFSDCILNGKNPEPSGAEGLADVRIIRALRESAEKGRPVEIVPPEKNQRPGIQQEIHKPPVDKPPELVRAHSPSQ
jgi:glucose-fructose oxidoreductase